MSHLEYSAMIFTNRKYFEELGDIFKYMYIDFTKDLSDFLNQALFSGQ